MKGEVFIKIESVEFKIGRIKIMHMEGTSSLVIGNSRYEKQTSHSKSNSGVGSAYGDGAEITMSPERSILYDGDIKDNPSETDETTYNFSKHRKMFDGKLKWED